MQCPNECEADVSIILPAASQSRDHSYLRLGPLNRLSAPHPRIRVTHYGYYMTGIPRPHHMT